MKIVITGGAGFIGSEFVRAFIRGDYLKFGLHATEVVVIDSLTYAGNLLNLKEIQSDDRLKFVHGDITDSKLVNQITKDSSLIVNFAAESHVDRSIDFSSTFIRSNIVGAQTIFDTALKNKVGRVVQVSTDEVYGSIATGAWNEQNPLLPNSPYSASKASADLIARAYHQTYGLNVITTRCSNNYGPYQHIEKFIPKLITNMIKNKDLPIYGDGANVREWIHVSDHAAAIALISAKGKSGEIYNIGSNDHYSNMEVAELLLQEIDFTKSVIEFVADRLGHDFRYSLDWTKSQNLGFEKTIQFKEGLARTINWYRENQEWWDHG